MFWLKPYKYGDSKMLHLKNQCAACFYFMFVISVNGYELNISYQFEDNSLRKNICFPWYPDWKHPSPALSLFFFFWHNGKASLFSFFGSSFQFCPPTFLIFLSFPSLFSVLSFPVQIQPTLPVFSGSVRLTDISENP